MIMGRPSFAFMTYRIASFLLGVRRDHEVTSMNLADDLR